MTLEHLKRLELLKTLIALEEKELLLSQVEKLEDEVPEKHVQEIAEAVRNIAYGDAVRRIDEILQEFKKTKYDKSYIEDAKLNRINSIKESLQSNVFLASTMNSYLFEAQPITTINQLESAAKSVSSWDIMNYAKKTFTDNFIQASLLPKEN